MVEQAHNNVGEYKQPIEGHLQNTHRLPDTTDHLALGDTSVLRTQHPNREDEEDIKNSDPGEGTVNVSLAGAALRGEGEIGCPDYSKPLRHRPSGQSHDTQDRGIPAIRLMHEEHPTVASRR